MVHVEALGSIESTAAWPRLRLWSSNTFFTTVRRGVQARRPVVNQSVHYQRKQALFNRANPGDVAIPYLQRAGRGSR